jgi:hypothetical protein
MPGLGNQAVVTKTGPPIQIDDPKAADELLRLAQAAAKERRRIIYFCGCPFAKLDGAVHCHRWEVGSLVLKAAKRRGVAIELVECPGGEPTEIELELDRKLFRSVVNDRMTIPTGGPHEPGPLARPAWGSVLTMTHGHEMVHRLVGPMMPSRDGWNHQVLYWYEDSSVGK